MDSPVPRPSESRDNNPIFCSPPGNLIICDQEELDRGAYGSVYAGEFAGRPVAVKRIHPPLLEAHLAQGQQVRRDFQAECQRMKDIGERPNVVRFIGAFQDRTGPFLVMEKMAQNLYTFLEANRGTLRLQQQLRLCLDIATGLAFLHSRVPPLVHRDLTASNVLLDESGRAKIGDLGQSKLKTAAHFQTRQPGAVPYMPPEALRTQPEYTEKVDIFSFGVLMLEIATQTPPSGGLDGIDTKPEEERRSSDLARVAEDHPLKSWIRLCLKNEPGERPDAATLQQDLQQLAQATVAFAEAKKLFNEAIESLEESHCEVMQLARKTRSPEFEDVRGLSTARVAEILKVVERSEMKVVFFGRTSNGKSTVINALLKSKVLPSGYGSTTTTVCYIRGQSTATEGGFVEFAGSNERIPVESAQDLASHMKEPRDIQIYWSTAQCSMLKGDIVLVDCPGMNAESEMDDKVIECCSDADVFVYVANGTTTFETTERHMLAQVREKISSPSNTFILFNQWDRVVEDGEEQARDVREQQMSKVTRIMVRDLSIFTEGMVADRTFFVSAKQALNNVARHAGNAPQSESDLQHEFSNFERVLQECLLEEAITTKFGRHYSECQPIVASLRKAVTGMKRRWKVECDAQEAELRTTELVLEKIKIRMNNLDQIYSKTVEDALKAVYAMCDKFHSDAEKRMSKEVKDYKPKEGFDPKKVDHYCEQLKTHLQEKLREEDSQLKEHWTSLAIGIVQSLCEPLQHVEEDVRRLEAEEASIQLGSQEDDCIDSSKIAQKQTYSLRRKMTRILIGGAAGLTEGAVVGLIGGAAVGAAAAIVGVPVGLALGVASILIMEPDSMTEDQAREEMCQRLITFLKKKNDEKKIRCREGLQEHIKSSTDRAYQHASEQKQEAVVKLRDRILVLRSWLSEALPLAKKLEEMDSQLKTFRETYLEV